MASPLPFTVRVTSSPNHSEIRNVNSTYQSYETNSSFNCSLFARSFDVPFDNRLFLHTIEITFQIGNNKRSEFKVLYDVTVGVEQKILLIIMKRDVKHGIPFRSFIKQNESFGKADANVTNDEALA